MIASQQRARSGGVVCKLKLELLINIKVLYLDLKEAFLLFRQVLIKKF